MLAWLSPTRTSVRVVKPEHHRTNVRLGRWASRISDLFLTAICSAPGSFVDQSHELSVRRLLIPIDRGRRRQEEFGEKIEELVMRCYEML